MQDCCLILRSLCELHPNPTILERALSSDQSKFSNFYIFRKTFYYLMCVCQSQRDTDNQLAK